MLSVDFLVGTSKLKL